MRDLILQLSKSSIYSTKPHGKLIASGTPDELKAQAADDSQTDPTMEQAFITLINRWDKENSHGQ